MSMRTLGGAVIALLLGSCTLLNSPESGDLCSEHGGSCDPKATCHVGESTFRCVCQPGYRDVRGDGTLCRDRDECSDGSARCDAKAQCTNKPGSYSCACPPGYLESLQGRQCDEINQCTTGQHSCDAETQVCRNVAGPEVTCDCRAGYEPVDGGACVDIDECKDDAHDCVPPAQCVNELTGFRCECPADTTAVGRTRCETHDPCAPGSNDCGANTRCVATGSDSHDCECLDGYEHLDSVRCRDIDECLDSPCKDGAQCKNREGSFSCECLGYYFEVDGGCEDSRLTWSTALGSHWLLQPMPDAQGNLVLAGTFSGSIAPCDGEPALTSAGLRDAFVVKYGPDRACLWADSYGDLGQDELIGAAIDGDGNPVLSIAFGGMFELGGVPVDSGGFRARVIAKLDGGEGHAHWAHVFFNIDSEDPDERILYGGLGTDAQRDVLWATAVRSGVKLDAGVYDAGTTARRDAVVAKLDASNGGLVWAKVFGGPFTSIATGITATAAGDVVVTGIFQDRIEIGGTPLQSSVQGGTLSSGFAAALLPDGTVRWQRLIDGIVEPKGANRTAGLSVTVADGDQVVVGGAFSDTLRVDREISSAGLRDVFLLGLDASSGAQTWVRTFGNTGDEALDQLASANGELVAVGSFDQVLELGDATLSAFARDIFALDFDAQGEPLWAQRFGGSGLDHMAGVAKSPQGDTFATGAFKPPLLVGDTVLPSPSPSSPESGFVLQLRR